MNSPATRRDFLKASSLAAVGYWVGSSLPAQESKSPNEKLNLGIIGTNHRARANIAGVRSENVVAYCDIDDRYLAEARTMFPGADAYHDFRKLLDRGDLDAVVVSTPDHVHVPASVRAMQAGLDVYCEKPLANTVWEARLAADVAREKKRVTQMGTQIHSTENYRRVVEIIESRALGPIREAHSWVGKSWGGGERPAETPPIPPHIHWDLWQGPAKERPYHSIYLPQNWRRYWSYGGGTLGDMGCHHLDLVFWALKLRHPTSVRAVGEQPHPETSPPGGVEAHWEFPRRGDLPPVTVSWWDSGRRPPQFAEGLLPKWGDGSLFVGEKGMLIANYGSYQLLPEKDFQDYTPPPKTIPRSIGHYQEWIQAVKTRGETTCNFDYSGALTEAVLLGTVAYRTGEEKLEWDARNLKVVNSEKAQGLIRREYRKGWEFSL